MTWTSQMGVMPARSIHVSRIVLCLLDVRNDALQDILHTRNTDM